MESYPVGALVRVYQIAALELAVPSVLGRVTDSHIPGSAWRRIAILTGSYAGRDRWAEIRHLAPASEEEKALILLACL